VEEIRRDLDTHFLCLRSGCRPGRRRRRFGSAISIGGLHHRRFSSAGEHREKLRAPRARRFNVFPQRLGGGD